ncbi:MAG: hypothetical protein Q8S13_08035 [Dehalococcoidia bacterium]|nr:hypothetical protein [Dehalococcoidia bacterium]
MDESAQRQSQQAPVESSATPELQQAPHTISALRLLGWILLVVGPVLALVACVGIAAADELDSTSASTIVIAGLFSLVSGIVLLALADLMLLLLDLVRNTRAAALAATGQDRGHQ